MVDDQSFLEEMVEKISQGMSMPQLNDFAKQVIQAETKIKKRQFKSMKTDEFSKGGGQFNKTDGQKSLSEFGLQQN